MIYGYAVVILFLLSGIMYFAITLSLIGLFMGMIRPSNVLFFIDDERINRKNVAKIYIGLTIVSIILGAIFYYGGKYLLRFN